MGKDTDKSKKYKRKAEKYRKKAKKEAQKAKKLAKKADAGLKHLEKETRRLRSIQKLLEPVPHGMAAEERPQPSPAELAGELTDSTAPDSEGSTEE